MRHWILCVAYFAALAFGWWGAAPVVAAAELHKTENVIFCMNDGFRWQEVFGGVETSLLNKSNVEPKNPARVAALKQRFCRETPEASREAVMPFFWSVIAKNGQIYGNQTKQSAAKITNTMKFSYPCYNETLCGFPDSRINRNDFGPNPNVTVLEWLHRKPAFQGRMAAFGAWNAFNDIFNQKRCGFCVNSAFQPLTQGTLNDRIELLNQLKIDLPAVIATEALDAITFHTALEYFKLNRPRVLFIAMGETDFWGHKGRYDEYLIAGRRYDDFVERIWNLAQSMPEYRGKTALILSTDHGRGSGPAAWKDHSPKTDGAEDIWMAFLGPDTPALGMRTEIPTVTENQIAATLAALLGEDYCADVPNAGKQIADALGKPGN
jgi:hypothetical protein